jgi:Mg-chelatase subunit ChlD
VPGGNNVMLTLELLGKPYLRTSLSLLDAGGEALKHFDPVRQAAQRVNLSWAITPGDYLVKVTEPPISLVLIWDTSGSMGQSFKDLQQAVEAYLDQVRPSERLNLIRFSDQVEVLLPEFTDDRERLKAASQGKFFAEGGTPFYDAVAKGVELLEGAPGNRAIVVMTDGADSSSRLQHPDFWRLLEQKRLRLYTIGLGGEMRGYSPRIGTSPNRLLAHAAMAMNGRFFFAHTSEELQGFSQQIADEPRTPSTYYVRPTVSGGPGRLSVEATGERMTAMAAPPQIELILDASGSMKQKVDGRPKIDTAKVVMAQIIDSLPEGTGWRYGFTAIASVRNSRATASTLSWSFHSPRLTKRDC